MSLCVCVVHTNHIAHKIPPNFMSKQFHLEAMRRTSRNPAPIYREENVNDENSPVSIRRSIRKKTPSSKAKDIENLFAKRTPSKEKVCDRNSDKNDESVNEEDDVNEIKSVQTVHSRALFNDEKDVAGIDIYGFRSPKRRDGMQRLAHDTPKTPITALKKMSLDSPYTPITALKNVSLNSPRTPQTSRTPAASSARVQKNLFTPAETRNINKKVLQKRAQKTAELSESETESSADEHSDYEGEDTSESSEDESGDSTNEDEVELKPTKDTRKIVHNIGNSSKVNATPLSIRTRGRAKATQYDDFIPDSDNYFMTASNKKSKTSDHTLDRLKSSRLQHEELFGLLSSIQTSAEHQHRIADMLHGYEQNFDRWMLEMHKGYNIIVYGGGSKQQLLHAFCEAHFAYRPLIVVNGFFPSLTIKDILQAIKVQTLDITANSRSDHEVVDLIASALDSAPNKHVYLVINNIDGVMLRKTKDQHIISRLAKIKNLHLIASMDHINAPLMWDQTCINNFNFVWYDCTTLLPYKNETAFENSVFFQNSNELDLAAMSNVFRSLTTNARGIYMILVKNQLANQKDSNYQGMTFKELYQKCRESFLVSSDSTLRTQLIEFVDHNMAKRKRSHDATELVSIPISAQILTLFMQQQSD